MSISNLTFAKYVGDGNRVSFPIATNGESMGYFRSLDINGYVDGEKVVTHIDYNSPHMLIFAVAPKDKSEVMVRREMPLRLPYANFERGNNFGHRQVNNTFLQQLYLTQELLDGFYPEGFYLKQELNVGSNRITNVANAKEDSDAINKGQVDAMDAEMAEWQEEQDGRILDLEQSITAGNLVYRRVVFTATEGQTEFNPNATFGGILNLYINGVNQIAGEAYESVDGRLIKTVPLDEGDRVVAIIGQEPQFVEPEQTDFRYVRYPFFAVGGETTYVLPADAKQVMSLYINGNHQTYQGAFDFDVSTQTVNFAEALEGGDEVVVYAGSEPAVDGDASNLPVTAEGYSITKTLRSWMRLAVEFGKNLVTSRGSTTSRSLEDRFADSVNVKDFGAVGDGVTDDKASIQEAINNAQSEGKKLVMTSKSLISSGLSINPQLPFIAELNIVSDAGILDITNTPFLVSQLSTFANYGNRNIILQSSPSGVSYGDTVTIVSNEPMEETHRPSDKFFTARVVSVSGSNVVLDRPVVVNFSNGFTHVVNFYRNKEVNIKGSLVCTATTANEAIYIKGMADVNLAVNISEIGGSYQGQSDPIGNPLGYSNGVVLHECVDAVLTDSVFDSVHYAILAHNGTSGTRNTRSKVRNSRHTMNTAYCADDNKNTDCKSNGCYAGFDSHETAIRTTHINCSSENDEIQCKFRGRSDYVTGNYDKASLETDAGLQAAYNLNEPIGNSLTKYFSGRINSGLVRCTGNAVEFNSLDGGNIALLTSSNGAECKSLSLTGKCRINLFDESALGVVAVIPQPKGSLYVENLKIKGENSGSIPTDAMNGNMIGIYLINDEQFTILDYEVIGSRSALYFNMFDMTYANSSLGSITSTRCGDGIRVVGSGSTYLSSFDSYSVSENYQDGSSLNKLKTKSVYFDGTVESIRDATPNAIGRLIL